MFTPLCFLILASIIAFVGFKCPDATRLEQADAPLLVVAASYPGVSAQVVADTVATPIDEQINGVEKLVRIEPTSGSDGRYTAHLYFKPKTDPKAVMKLVQRRVALAEPALPDAVRRNKISVTVGKAEAGPRKVTIAVIDRPGHGRKELQNAAAAVLKRVKAKDALIDPQVFPPRDEKQVIIDIDRAKCASLGVPIDDVFEAVRAAGSAMKPERLKKVIVRDKVTLGDVAAIKEGYGPSAVYSVNYFPAVRITGVPPEGQSVAEAAAKSVDLAEAELKHLGSRGFAVENLSAK